MGEIAYEIDGRTRIATFVIDTPGPVNTIGAGFVSALMKAVTRASEDRARGVILASGKPKSFLDGANLVEIAKDPSAFELGHLLAKLHDALSALAEGPFPVVAILEDQTALGGGFETLMWACDHVFATNGSRMGLPEVNVGLFPAAGGMETLRRVAGMDAMLDVVMNGRVLPAGDFAATGVVSLASAEGRRGRARDWILAHQGGTNRNHDRLWKAPDEEAGKAGAWKESISRARKRWCGCAERPWFGAALDALEEGLDLGFEQAVRAEVRHFAPLIEHPNSRCKIDLFMTVTGVAPRLAQAGAGTGKPRDVKAIAVIGAGLMGRGIAQVSADAGLDVLLLDVDAAAASAGRDRIAKDLEPLVRKGKWPQSRVEKLMARMRAGTGLGDIGDVPLVIESVFEDLALKRRVLADVQASSPGIVFATNTSTLPMDEIAAGSAGRPEAVVGMHYFSPVPLMPLMEVVRGPRTGAEELATAVHVGLRQKKTVIVVGDGPGFYTSRTFGVFVLTGLHLAEAGMDPWEVDRIAVEAGFPQGPLDVYGTAGGNVIHHAAMAMKERLGDRIDVPASLDRLWKAGYVGAGKPCFYKEGGGGGAAGAAGKHGKEPDRSVLEHLARPDGVVQPTREEAKEMLLLGMVNQAFLCMDDGVLEDFYTMDLGAVLGIGFPDCWHGPARHASLKGLRTLRERLAELHARHGLAVFRPSKEIDRLIACGADRALV